MTDGDPNQNDLDIRIRAVARDIKNAPEIQPTDLPKVTSKDENATKSESDSSIGDASDAERGTVERRRRGGQTAAAKLLEIIENKVAFWFSHDEQAYATIPVGDWRDGSLVQGHWEHVALLHPRFEDFLVEEYFVATGSPPGSQCIADTLRLCRVKARVSGEIHTTHVRVGEHDGELWIDLCDPEWRTVRVQSHGWSIEKNSPVKFIRGSAMRPLPAPERDDRTLENLLWPLLNVGSRPDFMLLVGFMVGAFRPEGPYAILSIDGPQGSAKSSLSRIVRSLLDPSGAALRSAPASETDLLVAAENSWIIALDNQSELSIWLCDALCRLATGSGLSQRQLYTNKSEVWFAAARPIILNGIPGIGSRADLTDRAIMLTLPQIDDHKRRDEHGLRAELEANSGLIFGALLSALTWAVADFDSTSPGSTRMSDFVRWVEAAAPGLGWEHGEFTKAYLDNRSGANTNVIEADVVARAIVAFMDEQVEGLWEGAPTELLSELQKIVRGWPSGESILSSKSWPAPNRLRQRLRRAQEPLRRESILIDMDDRSSGKRIFRIRRSDPTGS